MRLFFAYDIPNELKNEIGLTARQSVQGVRGIKWVETENLHLTLKFLGEVSPDKIDGLVEVARTSVEGCSVQRLGIGKPGFFPNWKTPRVVWLAITGETHMAAQVGKRLDTGLLPGGFDPENNRKLHLTIGRLNHSAAAEPMIEWARNYEPPKTGDSFQVKELVLYRSELTSSGPIYSIVEKFPFTG